jgi:triacylglycerol lipase
VIRRRTSEPAQYNDGAMGKKLEFAIGVLNGVVGDYLERTGNGLAIEMACYLDERAVPLTRAGLQAAYPNATPRIALLVHGIMCTETVWEMPSGDDYGSLLARDFGITPVYVRYNTGRAIPNNGRALALLLDALVAAYPVPVDEIVAIGYSMGGLVLRSACHVAASESQAWLPLLRRAFYVGTPHLGAPLERVGRIVANVLNAVPDPYTRLIADIANLRSDGVKDLGDGDVRDEDRERRTLPRGLRDAMHPVPLLPSIEHYLIAGTLHADSRIAAVFGDSLVPVPSGTYEPRHSTASAAFPTGHVRVLSGVGHLALAHNSDVYAQLCEWLEQEPQA